VVTAARAPLARVLFLDVAAYAGDQVRIGLEKDDLFQRPRARSRAALYLARGRVAQRAPRLFDFALVDVLVYGHRRVQTHIW
jgi:hypothetical protein